MGCCSMVLPLALGHQKASTQFKVHIVISDYSRFSRFLVKLAVRFIYLFCWRVLSSVPVISVRRDFWEVRRDHSLLIEAWIKRMLTVLASMREI